jgi:RNA polymerase sigma-70 factor (ECF subfamily)
VILDHIFNYDPIDTTLRNSNMHLQSSLSFDFKPRSFCTSFSQLISVEEKNSTTYMNKSFANNWSNCIKKLSEDRDVDAFRELFNYFSPRIKSFLLKSGGSVSQAEECMQEAMASVWQKAHMFDPTKASAATWIFTIARNKQLDAIRKIRRPEPEDLPWMESKQDDPSESLILQEEQKNLAFAVSKLPKKQRILIEKAFYGDLSHSKISELTDLPLGTVKSRIRLSIERLRKELGKQI